ncbi:MAG: CPBP family intramembrane metalloprotease [Solirubrobacterales bacterium]|nr:CPBP family intramembrane metalloprotease [Solirubrobacterales bacterium]
MASSSDKPSPPGGWAGRGPADEPESERPVSQVSLLIAPAAVLIGLVLALLATVITTSVGSAFGSPVTHPTPMVNIIASVVTDLCFVGTALYLVFMSNKIGGEGRRRMGARDFGYVRIPLWLGVLGFVIFAVIYYAISFLYSQAAGLHGTDKLPPELGTSQVGITAVATTVFACVVAPVCEEFFFRGFLFGVLRRMRVSVGGISLGPAIAAVLVGVLFGLAHAGSAKSEYLIPLALLGITLCGLRWWTGSLYPGMALHSLNNCLALGVNQMHWSAAVIVPVMAGSLLVMALLTGAFSRGNSQLRPAWP